MPSYEHEGLIRLFRNRPELAPELLRERRVLYYGLLAAISDAARKALEKLMASGDYEFHSDFAKTFMARGRVEGEAKGRVEGEAKALLVLLEARGLRVSAEVRARIVGCEDGAQLDAWIRKAVSVGSVDELF
jgi:hypothetical protein